MTKLLMAALFVTAFAGAQPALAPPRLGFIQDSAHRLRPVYGIAGNFILGPPITLNTVNAAFGGSFGLMKTASSLQAFSARGQLLASFNTAPGPALFAFSPDGTQALAYIPAAHSLLESDGRTFHSIPLVGTAISNVVAIAFPGANQAALLVQRGAAVWQLDLPLDAGTTASQYALMGVEPPLLALPSGDLVYRAEDGIAIRRPSGSEVHLPAVLPAHFGLAQINKDWVELTGLAGVHLAIHTTPGGEALYQLPEISGAQSHSERLAR